jgi:hypothetical protein
MSILVEKLDCTKMVRYLALKNWRDLGAVYSGKVKQMQSPDGKYVVLLPMVNTFEDNDEVMLRALRVIAKYEETPDVSLYNRLTNPSYDFLRWRIAGDSTAGGNIPFNSMGANIDFIKDMLSTACLDILSPSVYHAKVYTKEVNEQLAQYSFGQTEIGSYIMNILCPLGNYQYQLFDPTTESLPLARRINLNILDNIETIQRSVEDNSKELNDKVESLAISVNFLSSLSEMYEENKDSQITLKADWNGDVPLIGNQNPVSNVLLKPKCLERVMQTVEEYTPKEEQNVKATYFGKITNIGTEAEIENRTMFDIKVATIGEYLRTVYVVATLSYSEFFIKADKAFQKGANVKISGIKTTTARSIKLKEASIEVLE